MSQIISIDMQIGMKYAGNNKDLYRKMIDRFYLNYSNINLDSMDYDEFRRAIHNLKTISMSIGAINLHDIAKEIDEKGSKEQLSNLNKEMKLVLSDLKNIIELI